MKTAVITEPKKIEIVETDKPSISDGQIMIKTRVASICGSDMPFFLNERPMNYPLPPGHPGHENIGTVVESKCKEYKEGDEVLALPAGSNGFAEYFVSSPPVTVRLPDVYDNNIVVAQPLGTVLHACRKLFYPLLDKGKREKSLDIDSWDLSGTRVAIVGQGSIGLLFTGLMKMMNADTIIGIDPLEYRLNVAKKMGATHVVKSAAQAREITDGKMADLVIEAVGNVSTINDCFSVARKDGMILAFGVPRESIYSLNFPEFFRKEQRFACSVGPEVQLEFPPAVELVNSGKLDISPMVTHCLPFDDIQKAFEMVSYRTEGAIKVLLEAN